MDNIIPILAPVFIFGMFVFIALANMRHARTHYGQYPTFDEYQKMHPNLVRHGRVECIKCGGTKIQVRGLWGPTDKKKTHSCMTCGTPLYRTAH